MKLQQVLMVLNKIAPENLAESWDHPGLQVGDPAWLVKRGLLAIDLNPAVLAEARHRRADLIVAYHPPIFEPLPALTSLVPKQAVVLTAAMHRIAVYSPHTALDAVVGGVNDFLAQALGPGKVSPIRQSPSPAPAQCEVVTFAPLEYADQLRRVLSAAGAGIIGDYRECSFGLVGEGTFHGGPATHPKVGKKGRFERVREMRLEMICPANQVANVVAAIRHHHPYEEPAFYIYPLVNVEPAQPPPLPGQGRLIDLDRPAQLKEILKRLKAKLKLRQLEVVFPERLKLTSPVRRAAVCAGAGGSLLPDAQLVAATTEKSDSPSPAPSRPRLDVFITGEMRHHDVLAARAQGVAVILAGHTQTERPYLPVYRRLLAKAAPPIDWIVSRADVPPSRRI